MIDGMGREPWAPTTEAPSFMMSRSEKPRPASNTPGNRGPASQKPAGIAIGEIAQRIDSFLLWAVDAGLAALILLVPLAMGGRTALGQLVLVVLADGIAVCWCLRQGLFSDTTWIRSSGSLLTLGMLGLILLQVTPLPPSWLEWLSPHVYKILPLWAPETHGAGTIGLWKTLSLTPAATRDGLVVAMAFGMLFLVVVQRVRRPADVEFLLRWISLATLIMAVFALAQFFFGNGKFFWCFEHPYSDTHDAVKGSFSNRNHFAHFMALGAGPLIWWLHTTWRRTPDDHAGKPFSKVPARPRIATGLLAIGLAVTIFAGALSLSRGGTAAMVLAALFCLLILYRSKRVNRKVLIALAGTAALTSACLVVYGYQAVVARLEQFSSLDQLDSTHGRRKIWQADLAAMSDFLVAGTGLGSHVEVYPRYLPEDEELQSAEYTHAENGYVQIAMEAGIPGLVLVGIAIGLCIRWCVPSFRSGTAGPISLCFAGIAPCLLASAVHSATDFVWYVPGCMVTPVVLAACACRLRQMADSHRDAAATRINLPRTCWIAATGFLLAVGVMLAQNRATALLAEPSWHRYLKTSAASASLDQLTDWKTLQSMAEDLATVVRYQPDNTQAQVQLAVINLRMFDCAPEPRAMPMDVRQVREAVLASKFPSAEAMNQWLSRAFGTRRRYLDAAAWHARRALSSCPLRGDAYLCLAELSFLAGAQSPGKTAYINQALIVRPFDGVILFVAGQEAALDGDLLRAGLYWRASFQAGSFHRNRLLQALAGRIPASALIEMLQPDLAGLSQMVCFYQSQSAADNLSQTVEQYIKVCEREAPAMPPQKAAEAWAVAGSAYRWLGRPADAIRCIRNALRYEPFYFDAKLLLGSCLLDSKDYAEAVTHLKWCAQQAPRNHAAQRDLERAIDGQLRHNRSAASDGDTMSPSASAAPTPRIR